MLGVSRRRHYSYRLQELFRVVVLVADLRIGFLLLRPVEAALGLFAILIQLVYLVVTLLRLIFNALELIDKSGLKPLLYESQMSVAALRRATSALSDPLGS